ncbi:hypothetical protein Rhopal_000290-T1 [Rhodotorula paludigena]|uniref:G-patch domain-containing protein n=1 Tax=Rhodotorula paludigena TaxID=86838 RepID=A0AAV5GCI4_9BASI|nr:hypothetical protein Rhopal_000290-T1 [Rhodotorula paludigena]
MSLYGGISFKGTAKPPAEAPATPAAPAAPAATSSAAAPEASTPAGDDKPKSAAWSAALRFAPTTRKKPSTPSSRPSAAALRSVFGAAEDDATAAPPAGASGPRIAAVGKVSLTTAPDKAPPPSKWTAVSKPQVEIKPFASTSGNASPAPSSKSATPGAASTRTRVRRIIAAPPAMTLEEDLTDVNGFAQSEAGKKAAQQNKKRGKKRGKARDDPALAFGDIQYDPARPCDYSAYKTHVKLQRAQRRLEREEEERRRRREGSASGSSYYSEDDEDRQKENEPANKKARFFAPPASYDAPAAPTFPPPASYDPPHAPSREETADEAYARRVAMSNPAPPRREETGDEAYQRRIAMSQRKEETGDEAYRRRLAMSQGAPPPPPAPLNPAAPSFVAPSFVSPAGSAVASPSRPHPPGFGFGGPPPSAPPAGFIPPPPPPGFVPPPFASPSADFPPFRPPSGTASPVPPVPPTSAPPAPAGAAEALDAAQAKAREIAARLSKLGGAFAAPPGAAGAAGAAGPSAPPGFAPASSAAGGAGPTEAAGPPAEPDTRSFAERMMSKYGWEEGKGLGAGESGMTSALSVQRAAPTGSSSKKAKKKQEDSATQPTAGMAGRSVVIDASREQRIEEQKAQMGGDASRVVLLTNLCGADEVDDDLPGEVAEEANKIGVVERCFVYVVPGETRDDEAVRIFLVMSGLAGGYNAVRSFEGRFFGGRTVRARFYDEKAFNAGLHTL